MTNLYIENRLFYIGNICAQWSSLEYQFAKAIWHLLGIDDETGKIVTGGTDMIPRIRLAVNLARHLNAPLAICRALEGARDKLLAANLDERRNRAVHGIRFAMDGDDDLRVVEIEVHRGKGGRHRQQETTLELYDVGSELSVIVNDLREALTQEGLFASPQSRPAKVISRKARARKSGSESQPAS